MIESIIDLGLTLIKRIFPDKEAQDKATIELMQLQTSGELAKIAEQSKVVVAEAQSQSVIARNWRPIMMLVFVFIIFNNYILVPYAGMFHVIIPALAIPEKMWSLLEIGIGGYIVGRSGESIARILKK
uniref:Putative structural protein n=1 Tax=viral metagenome TaxID=1070528 RepID=A0A6M3KQL0_9ZZZZ